ncbi:VOC family protein [Streptomyces sp. NPDC001985]|uniref:VOC family protein n=1 Tax=Streptomyces sp. NPDC001985 TaxID=3154406 RepID=UPI0033205588
MTARPGSLNGFCWLDLKTGDTAAAGEFFGAVLGWGFAVDEEDWRRAVKISAGGWRIGGVSDLSAPVYPPGTPAHLAYYLAVDEVDRRAERAVAGGARLVVEPFDAGDQGRMATLVDPFGAAVSLWQAREFTGWGFPAGGAAGLPHRMVLACADPAGARAFYRDALGVEPRPGDVVAAPGEPGWRLEVAVDDPGAVSEAAARSGGEVREGVLYAPEGLALRISRAARP